MRMTSKFLALALTATMQSAMAGAVLLNFEDITTTAAMPASYHGVGVDGAAWGAASSACYGDTEFSFIRSGSCGALLLAQDPTKNPTGAVNSLTLTLTDGFIDALSFVYSGRTRSTNLSVHVYDEAGDELGLGLSGLTGAGCSTYVFCNWSNTVTLAFDGVARSVVFSAVDQTVLFDDLSFTTPSAPGRLPEPTSVALALGALSAVGWTRRRTAR